MLKKLLLVSLLAFVIGMPSLMAQEEVYASESQTTDTVVSQIKTKRSISKYNRDENRFAVSFQIPCNTNKLGAGVKFSYDFTDILRFSVEGNYYFCQWGRRFNTITYSGVKGHASWGRRFDISPNLNFVFGRNNFHFYIIAGLYFSMGYSETESFIMEEYSDAAVGTFINKEYYYYKEKLPFSIGFGGNIGCGIEYQVNKNFRVFLDQQWSLGIMSAWMGKVGASYCF